MPHEEDYSFRLRDRVRSLIGTDWIGIVVSRFHTNLHNQPRYVVEGRDGELYIFRPNDLIHVGPSGE